MLKRVFFKLFLIFAISLPVFAQPNLTVKDLYNQLKDDNSPTKWVKLEGNRLYFYIVMKNKTKEDMAYLKKKETLRKLLKQLMFNQATILCNNPNLGNALENGEFVYRYLLPKVGKDAQYETIVNNNVCKAYNQNDVSLMEKELNEAVNYSYKKLYPYLKNAKEISAYEGAKRKFEAIQGKRIDVYTVLEVARLDKRTKTVTMIYKGDIMQNASEKNKEIYEYLLEAPSDDIKRVIKQANVKSLKYTLPYVYKLVTQEGWKVNMTYDLSKDKKISFTITKEDFRR